MERTNNSYNPPDWCWVQPTIFNIKVNNHSGDVTLPNGGGQVVLSFNSTADLEQLAVRFTIDWGDGSAPTRVGSDVAGFAPRSDIKGPYHDGFIHQYNAPDCLDGCTIRVFANDNWDHGSGYCGGGGATPQDCSEDKQCEGINPGYFGICSHGGAPCLSPDDLACTGDGPGQKSGVCMRCLGICRNTGAPVQRDFATCINRSQCGNPIGTPPVPNANCSSVNSGSVTVIPNP
jgi:hypothetical protein